MNDDERPGLDFGEDDAQTRLMTRRLARSDSSPVLVIPITSSYRRPIAPATTARSTGEEAQEIREVAETQTRQTTTVSLGTRAIVLMLVVAIVACGVGVCAGSRSRSGTQASPASVAAPARTSLDGIEPTSIGLSAFSAPAVSGERAPAAPLASSPAPPTTGVADQAASPPAGIPARAKVTTAAAPRHGTPRSTGARPPSPEQPARQSATPEAPGDDIADALKTARLASDEVAASLH
ncbi:MAG: hypothetical protein JWP87_1861 [Labilithrix sp.]|nr:hypothetical protein [Labilithrix sp.]